MPQDEKNVLEVPTFLQRARHTRTSDTCSLTGTVRSIVHKTRAHAKETSATYITQWLAQSMGMLAKKASRPGAAAAGRRRLGGGGGGGESGGWRRQRGGGRKQR